MNKSTLYLHIGTHKTGSTTIQAVLEQERDVLLEEGIVYLGRFNNISKKMKGMTVADKTLVSDFQDEVRKKIAGCNGANPLAYVISNEKYSGHNMMVYNNAGILAKTLREIFEPFQFDLKIIVYLRRQDKFFESVYSQKIKRGSSFTFHEFLEQIEDITDCHWDVFLDRFAEIFGKENLIVRRFDREYLPENNNLIQSFGSIINSEHLKDYRAKPVKNRGYTRDVLEIARHANKHLTKEQIRTLKYILMDVSHSSYDMSYFAMEERRNLLENYEESNSRVARTYLNDPDGNLFSTFDLNGEKPDEPYPGLTAEAVAVVFSQIVLDLNQQLSDEIEKNRKKLFLPKVRRAISRMIQKIR